VSELSAPDSVQERGTRFPAMASWDFRRLFANGFFITGSRWAQVLARGWLVHELTGGSTTAVGWVTFASFFPFVVVGPIAGAVADRFDRRKLLIIATAVGIVSASLLAAITILDVVQVWHVGVLAFFTGSTQAATVPARQALIANVVPKEDLLNAVALGGISQHGSRVIGPLFGAAFLSTLGPESVFVLSAVLLTLGLVEVIRVRHRPPLAEARPEGAPAPTLLSTSRQLGRDLAAAGRYVRADRRLVAVIGLVGAHCSFTMAFDSMMPTLSEVVGGSETLYSSILIALGAGAIAGTLGVSQLKSESLRGTMLALAAVGSGLAMVILGSAQTPVAVLAGAVLAGLTQASYMTMSAALVQTIVSDEFRGRVMSLYIMIAAGHMAILNLGYGRLAESIDVRLLLVVPGIAWTVIFVLASVGSANVRSLVIHGRFSSGAPVPTAA
jgi:MFS family permease